MKHIAWFSCGAASAVMSRILSKQIPDLHIVYNRVENEHKDNWRFLTDCSNWMGREIEITQSKKFKDVDDVIEKRKYISGHAGAPCTMELKRNVRLAYADINDINYWGFTVEEKKRATNYTGRNPQLINKYPLIEYGIRKADCLALIQEAGIELPIMYKLGYDHNNCIGCVKSGSPKYWNMIRRDFPEVFKKRAEQERKYKYALCRVKGVATYLDELNPQEIEHTDIDISCDLGCQMIYNEIIL
jgi:hypothetical protein